MMCVQCVDNALGGQIHTKRGIGAAVIVGEGNGVGGHKIPTGIGVHVGITPARGISIKYLMIELSLGVVVAAFCQLLGMYGVAAAVATGLKQSAMFGIIVRCKCHKTTPHVVIGRDQAADDAVDVLWTVDLLLDGPSIVAHHPFVGLEYAPYSHRFQSQLTLDAVVQFLLHQSMGIIVLAQ